VNYFIDEANFNFSNLNNKKEKTLGKYDPAKKHLTVHRGFNLKGRCNNENCLAYKHERSWVPKGYGTFDLGKERFKNKCQGCGSIIKGSSFKTFGFRYAEVHIEGTKIEGEK